MGIKQARRSPYLRMAVWSTLIVWLVFYIIFAFIGALKLSAKSTEIWSGAWGQAMSYLIPIWLIFTVLLTALLLTKWAGRKLK